MRQVYIFRCAYCGVTEVSVGAELTQDHFHPLSQGGSDTFENIVYACHTCNNLKREHWNPSGVERILHPLNADISLHITENPDGTLSGKTPTGIFHIQRLRLNRPSLVSHRREELLRKQTDALLSEVIQEVADLNALLQQLLRRLPPETLSED